MAKAVFISYPNQPLDTAFLRRFHGDVVVSETKNDRMRRQGLVLARLRQHVGLLQRQFAKEVGVSEATVRNWEHGRTPIRYAIVAKLAKVLRMTEAELHDKLD